MRYGHAFCGQALSARAAFQVLACAKHSLLSILVHRFILISSISALHPRTSSSTRSSLYRANCYNSPTGYDSQVVSQLTRHMPIYARPTILAAMHYRGWHSLQKFSFEWLTLFSQRDLRSLSLGITHPGFGSLQPPWSAFPYSEELSCVDFKPQFGEPLATQHPLKRV